MVTGGTESGMGHTETGGYDHASGYKLDFHPTARWMNGWPRRFPIMLVFAPLMELPCTKGLSTVEEHNVLARITIGTAPSFKKIG